MTPDEITVARQKYAQLSQEELAALPLCPPKDGRQNLRKIAREIGIVNVTQHGKLVKANAAQKEFVLKAINEALEAYRIAQEVKIVNSEVIEELPYQAYEEDLDNVAKKYYEGEFVKGTNEWQLMGLKEYHRRSLNKELNSLSPLIVLISQFRPELEQRIIARTGDSEAKPTTLHNWRAQVLKRIEQLCNRDKTELAEFSDIGHSFRLFYDGVQASFKSVRRERVEEQNKALNTRQNSAIEIKVGHLIEWARDRLVNLPEKSSDWREVAIALMVVTGRRQSEIMSSARFTLVDSDSHLEFSGQLKKHKSEFVGAYEIPILGCCANAVVDAINWLEGYGKRALPSDESYESQQKAAKKAHDNFSRYLSETAKSICDRYITTEADWKFVDEKGKEQDRRKCHLFRQIYGQSIIPVFYPRESGMGRKAKQILTEVMGHSDSPSSRKHAAESYDSDVFIVDIEAVKAACGKV